MEDCTPNIFWYKLLFTLVNVLTKFRYSIQRLTMWFGCVYVQWQSYLRLSRYLRERKTHQLWNIPAQLWEVVPPTDFDTSCFVPSFMCWRSFVTRFRGWRCDLAVCMSNDKAVFVCPDIYVNVKCRLWNIPAQLWEIVPTTYFDTSCFVPLSMCWWSFVTQFRGWRHDLAVCMSNDKAVFVCPDIYVNVKCINFETLQPSYGRLYPQQILIQVALYPRQCVDEVSLLNSEADDVIWLCVCPMSMLSVIVPISMLT